VAKEKKRRALGRGLDALFTPPRTSSASPDYDSKAVFSCPVERITPRRDQPRRSFDDAALEDLAATIAEHGIIQPLVVRRTDDDRFELIAGERRWRAAQRAGKKEVPVVVKDVSPDAAFEMALVENLQREDLNPIEVAESYERLIQEHGHTQEVLAKRVGKNRATVTNALRLLKLPDEVRLMVRDGMLSEGHGRALLGAANVDTMLVVARKAARGKLSVRKVEQLVRRSRGSGSGNDTKSDSNEDDKSAGIRDLELRITRVLGAKTAVEHRGKSGKLVVSYSDLDELDRIIAIIGA
jgi:ParB family chromosome partitioning protein